MGRGHRKAAVLYPNKSWGKRAARAFRRQWKQLGGTLIVPRAFNPSAASFAGTARKSSRQVARADFAFLIASRQAARRLWPRLRSEIGAKVSVYATTHICSGRFDPRVG